MLQLIDITKDYTVAGGAVHALNGISVRFRKNEFVSVLGASGCGKTTLLNIIGGLDNYTSGDLIINGKSTKEFDDRDWDTYRNHSIGFIFQSYHLIPHQTILQNVELALTISGVGKEERRQRAVEALEKVGLADKLHNRPNQLSGGQAQRVAIARALINDPEILLADEPTGALDSKTSVQIMELLKEISSDRLVIMVTHNPELAERYSTRIIRLLDGRITDDNNPYEGTETTAEEATESKTNKGKKKKTSMSMGMAFSLSLKNLLSKGKRTAMVSVAGSIGIIGVSMVLAISSGVRLYIASMQNDLLSGYPLAVTRTAIDYEALMNFAESSGTKADITKLHDKVYVDNLLDTLMSFSGSMTTNNITEDYARYVTDMPSEYYNAMQFGYDFDMSNYIYTDMAVGGDYTYTAADGTTQTEPAPVKNVSVTGIRQIYTSILEQQESYKQYASMISTVSSFREIPNNYEYIMSQYDILASYNGKTEKLTGDEYKDVFESKDSLIMVINDNGFSDLNFAQFGYMSEEEFLNFAFKAENEEGDYDHGVIEDFNSGKNFDYFIGENAHSFKWYPNDTVYVKPAPTDAFTYVSAGGQLVTIPGAALPFKYNAYSDGFAADRDKSDDVDLKVKIILQKKKSISYGCLSSGLYYTRALTDHALETGAKSKIAEYIKENGELNMMPYNYDYFYKKSFADKYIKSSASWYVYNIDNSSMFGGASGAEMLKVKLSNVAASDLPSSFKIYPLDFDSKDLVTKYLDGWNTMCENGFYEYTDADGKTVRVELTEEDKINYTDTVGLIITMVNTMIEMITVALVAFTALSLVVSTVMVGIITYVSVVERIKEIGILRAVGARKKDIKRLFNAETFIIGLCAGLVGIAVTYLLSLTLNLILGSLFGIYTIASLPWWQALIMVIISVALTLVSGLIPASAAAKKDPVVALRTE